MFDLRSSGRPGGIVNALILDTETTGIEDPHPVEIAWLRLQGPNDLSAEQMFSCRFKPGKPITLGAMATHHIRDEDVTDCESHTTFRLPDGVEYLIGHNIDYDWSAIGKPDVKRIDTCAFSRKLWPQADSHTQSAMLYLLERSRAREWLRGAHCASVDAYNCFRLLKHILKALGDPTTWEAVYALSEAARIPEVMPFGKHKGVRIADVPPDYKAWLLGQPGIDPYLATALRARAVS